MKKAVAIILSLTLIIGCFSSLKSGAFAASNSQINFDNVVQLPTSYGKSLIEGLSPMVCEYKKATEGYIVYDYTFDKYSLTDGNLDVDWYNNAAIFAEAGANGSIIR